MSNKESSNISFFEHAIECKPKTVFCIAIEDVQPNKRSKIQEANDCFVVINADDDFFFRKIMYVLSCILLLISIPFMSTNTYILLLPLSSLLVAIWRWALYYFNPPKNIVLNRMEGTISYPKRYFYKTPITVLFSEIKIFERLDDRATYTDEFGVREYSRYKSLYFRDPKTGSVLPLMLVQTEDIKTVKSNLNELCQIRSFYIWYIDKNRPLPTGTAFNPYREKDFDRRHKEGFKPPLYSSTINTTEKKIYQKKIKKEFLEKINKKNKKNN